MQTDANPTEVDRVSMDDLFDQLGSEGVNYSARCCALSGGWLQFDTLVARTHDGAQWVAVDQPGACPDCAAVPVAAVQLPGFVPPEGLDPALPLRLRGRLSYGFAIDEGGNASFLRLEDAQVVDTLMAGAPALAPAEVRS